jgi:hypothetical protein
VKREIHSQPHAQAGQTVTIKTGKFAGEKYRIEDYWDRLGQGSWMFCEGNPACLMYAMRSAMEQLPTDDEVVYGKIGAFGHLVHVSELG